MAAKTSSISLSSVIGALSLAVVLGVSAEVGPPGLRATLQPLGHVFGGQVVPPAPYIVPPLTPPLAPPAPAPVAPPFPNLNPIPACGAENQACCNSACGIGLTCAANKCEKSYCHPQLHQEGSPCTPPIVGGNGTCRLMVCVPVSPAYPPVNGNLPPVIGAPIGSNPAPGFPAYPPVNGNLPPVIGAPVTTHPAPGFPAYPPVNGNLPPVIGAPVGSNPAPGFPAYPPVNGNLPSLAPNSAQGQAGIRTVNVPGAPLSGAQGAASNDSNIQRMNGSDSSDTDRTMFPFDNQWNQWTSGNVPAGMDVYNMDPTVTQDPSVDPSMVPTTNTNIDPMRLLRLPNGSLPVGSQLPVQQQGMPVLNAVPGTAGYGMPVDMRGAPPLVLTPGVGNVAPAPRIVHTSVSEMTIAALKSAIGNQAILEVFDLFTRNFKNIHF